MAKNAFEMSGNVPANPGRAQHSAGVNDAHNPIGLNQDVSQDAAESLADDEALAMCLAQGQVAIEGELATPSG